MGMGKWWWRWWWWAEVPSKERQSQDLGLPKQVPHPTPSPSGFKAVCRGPEDTAIRFLSLTPLLEVSGPPSNS